MSVLIQRTSRFQFKLWPGCDCHHRPVLGPSGPRIHWCNWHSICGRNWRRVWHQTFPKGVCFLLRLQGHSAWNSTRWTPKLRCPNKKSLYVGNAWEIFLSETRWISAGSQLVDHGRVGAMNFLTRSAELKKAECVGTDDVVSHRCEQTEDSSFAAVGRFFRNSR